MKKLGLIGICFLIIFQFSCKKDYTIKEDIEEDNNNVMPPTEGLVSYFTFNESKVEDIQNGNVVIEHNIAYEKVGENNFAIHFNGIDNYVKLPSNFDFPKKTIHFNIKVASANEEADAIFVSDNPNLKNGMFMIMIEKKGSENHLIFNVSTITYKYKIELNKWYDISMSVDEDNIKCYVNGDIKSTIDNTKNTTSYNGFDNTILGSNRTISSRFFYGYMDNLLVYDRVLSSNEIKALAIY